MGMIKWLEGTGPEEDVVISSRIRLARNLNNYQFPQQMNLKDAESVTDEILNAAKDSIDSGYYKFIKIKDLDYLDKGFYVEKHLISPELVKNPMKSSVLLRDDEKVGIMINEEDHIRMQILSSGLNLEESWRLCSEIDDDLEEKLDYAFDEKLGYLTSCPTNVGTGLRASVMLHLPCLVFTRYINNIIQAVNQVGLTVRGLYGEGSEALGNLFQISNQTTLGETEEEMIQKLKNVAYQIINKERDIRNGFVSRRKMEIEDRVFRSYGVLKYVRIISSREAMKLLSDVKLGAEIGLIEDVNMKDISNLMILTQPASLQKCFKKEMAKEERDIKRAQLIRDKI